MPDVLLVQPPIRDFYLTRQRTLPYGLACIAGALLEAGFSTEICDALAAPKARELPWPAEMEYLRPHYGRADCSPFSLFHRYYHFGSSFDHVAEVVRDSGARLVGISSLFSAYSAEALRAAEAIRARHSDCRIVLGGHHPTAFPGEVLRCEAVDFVIQGEGERAMPELARALQGQGSLDSVPGLVWREGNNLLLNPPAEVDVERLPLPATELLRGRGQRHRAVLVASRGCPFHCSYCSFGASAALRYRRRGVSSVLGELAREIATRAVSFVDFEDENLSLDATWFLQLLEGIERQTKRRNDLELRAMNGLLPHTLDDNVIQAMRRAGFSTLNLSLGSSSAAQLARFRRCDERAGFERALELAGRYGLTAVGYVIAAAPGQEATASVDDLLYLAPRRVLGGLSIFYPAPGSEDFERCAEAGSLPASPSLWRSSTLPLEGSTSRQEAATLLRLARILGFMKSLADRGEALPVPAPLPAPRLAGSVTEIGRHLLAAFLFDGQIRGIDASGEVYLHPTSTPLCDRFRRGIEQVGVRGANSPANGPTRSNLGAVRSKGA